MNRRDFFPAVLAPALLLTTRSAHAASGFSAFARELADEAVASGLDRKSVQAEMAKVIYDEKVVALDHKQPEHTITFAEYEANAFRSDRVSMGQEMARRYCQPLAEIEQEYGVPAAYLLALWGSETNYGRFKGNHDVLQSLVTLAYGGRAGKFTDRRKMFRDQALAALQILTERRYDRTDLRGSYAGAFGNHQFMPKSFLAAATDRDGDGRADIINNPVDSFASAANLLKQKGWHNGGVWGRAVTLPAVLLEDKLGVDDKRPVTHWRQRGVRLASGAHLPSADDGEDSASLILPDRTRPERAYLFYNNAHTLWRWNNSSWFVVITHLTAERIAAGATLCPKGPTP